MQSQTYLENENYIFALLKEECKKHNLDFITDFGLRVLMYNGVFYGITTRKNWNYSVEKAELKHETKEYFLNELNFVFMHNITYVVRSKHMIGDSSFLRELADHELCNGIGVYVFTNYGIRVYFFNANHQAPDAINFFINNIKNIQRVVSNVDQKLQHDSFFLNVSLYGERYLTQQDLKAIKSTQITPNDGNQLVVLGGQEVLLTSCERQIVDLLQKGKCTKEIAQNLTRSSRTIEWHLKNIRQKANVHNTSDLITSI